MNTVSCSVNEFKIVLWMVVAINSLSDYNFTSEISWDYFVCVVMWETLLNCIWFHNENDRYFFSSKRNEYNFLLESPPGCNISSY